MICIARCSGGGSDAGGDVGDEVVFGFKVLGIDGGAIGGDGLDEEFAVAGHCFCEFEVDLGGAEAGFEHGIAQFGDGPESPVVCEGVDDACAIGEGEVHGVADAGVDGVGFDLLPLVADGVAFVVDVLGGDAGDECAGSCVEVGDEDAEGVEADECVAEVGDEAFAVVDFAESKVEGGDDIDAAGGGEDIIGNGVEAWEGIGVCVAETLAGVFERFGVAVGDDGGVGVVDREPGACDGAGSCEVFGESEWSAGVDGAEESGLHVGELGGDLVEVVSVESVASECVGGGRHVRAIRGRAGWTG